MHLIQKKTNNSRLYTVLEKNYFINQHTHLFIVFIKKANPIPRWYEAQYIKNKYTYVLIKRSK